MFRSSQRASLLTRALFLTFLLVLMVSIVFFPISSPGLLLPRSLKPGKVVIVLGGRFAGKKAVIVHTVNQGSNERRFGHALVAGIERYPLKVTKSMNKRTLAKRSRIKPFVKAVNYNHLMPTRYALDLGDGVKSAVPMDAANNPTARVGARKQVKKLLQERYNSGKNKWFFTKLRF